MTPESEEILMKLSREDYKDAIHAIRQLARFKAKSPLRMIQLTELAQRMEAATQPREEVMPNETST